MFSKFSKFSALAIAALSISSAPAMAAEFTGPRAAVVVGHDNLEGVKGLTYGGQIGYDVSVTKDVIAGVQAELTESNADLDGITVKRDVSVTARVGTKVTEDILGYVSAGYTNQRVGAGDYAANLDGYRVGGGVEVDLGNKFYTGAEYRYSNYEYGITSNKVQANVGYRF